LIGGFEIDGEIVEDGFEMCILQKLPQIVFVEMKGFRSADISQSTLGKISGTDNISRVIRVCY